ncbi:LysR family transcriptional regulator [Corynebacterium sp. HMSC068G04]|uniref:LysR family transcriptional regulator n=1 Tax=Corynebacterium sp. HMSC068G04 TaxID=1739497 RepID=UPI00143A9E48|nr:LysR family transcriptional regulator [Corynebacterium sp. HMSC068G04]
MLLGASIYRLVLLYGIEGEVRLLDLNRLEMFMAAVESGSIAKAAADLGVSSSAVSQQIKKLESEMGVSLLRRGGKGAIPTEGGVMLAEHGRRLLRQAAAAESDLKEMRDGRAGTLRIGTFPTFAASHLPGVIVEMRDRFPNVELEILSARFDKLLKYLEEGRVHLSVLWEYPWNPFSASGIVSTHLFKEGMVLIVPKGHWVAEHAGFDFADLREENWILRSDNHPAGEALERIASRSGFRPRITMYANDYNETQAMVSIGMGIAMAPASAVAIKHPDVVIVNLHTASRRSVFLAQRAERSYSTLENAFRNILIENLSKRA